MPLLAILSMSEMVCFSAVFGARQVVAVDGGADVLQRAAQARTELAVALAVLETLPMRFERGCVRCHVICNLRKPLILAQWPFQSSTSAAPMRPQPAASPRWRTCRSRSAAGEIVGLIGPNGAGKTTTLRSWPASCARPRAASGSTTTTCRRSARGEAAPGVHARRAAPVRIPDGRRAPAAGGPAVRRRRLRGARRGARSTNWS